MLNKNKKALIKQLLYFNRSIRDSEWSTLALLDLLDVITVVCNKVANKIEMRT